MKPKHETGHKTVRLRSFAVAVMLAVLTWPGATLAQSDGRSRNLATAGGAGQHEAACGSLGEADQGTQALDQELALDVRHRAFAGGIHQRLQLLAAWAPLSDLTRPHGDL